MSRLLLIAGLLGATVACAAANEMAAEPAPTHYVMAAAAPFEPACDIEVTRIDGGVRLEAFAPEFRASPEPLEYRFTVTKRDRAGSSDIVQGGEVVEPLLSSVDLSLDRGAGYRARLTLRDGDGQVCATEVRS